MDTTADTSTEKSHPSIFIKYGPVFFYIILQTVLIVAIYIIYDATATIFGVIGMLLWLGLLIALCYFDHYYIAWALIFIPLVFFIILAILL
jgi:hypothetical protein